MTLKAATIGCGRMGAFPSTTAANWTPDFWHPISHLPAIQKCENTLMVAAADISKQTRERVATHFGIPCYSTAEELLANHDIDILTLATRTPDKIKLIRQALAAGVQGFHIEKPLCNSVTDLTELEHLLRNVPVTYGCLRRYLSPYRNLAEMADELNLGKLTAMQVHMGRAMLCWTHPHSVDLMLMQMEQAPNAVQANFNPTEIVKDKSGIALIEDPMVLGATMFFNGGVTGHITPLAGNEFWAIYENGALRVMNDGRGLWTRQCLNGDPYPIDTSISFKVTHAGGTRAAIDLLSKAITKDPTALLEVARVKNDMFVGQRCLFAMALSHYEEGRPVCLDDVTKGVTLSGLYRGIPA